MTLESQLFELPELLNTTVLKAREVLGFRDSKRKKVSPVLRAKLLRRWPDEPDVLAGYLPAAFTFDVEPMIRHVKASDQTASPAV